MLKTLRLLFVSFLCIIICNSSLFAEVKICSEVEFSIIPVEERIATRSFPSVFEAWNPIWIEGIPDWERLVNAELVPYHDLVFNDFIIYPDLIESPKDQSFNGLVTDFVIDAERVKTLHHYYLSRNPNFVYLFEWTFFKNTLEAYPDDPIYWLTDTDGKRIEYPDSGTFIVNFLNPQVQEIIIAQGTAIASCGIFDGIMIDSFIHDGAGVLNRDRSPAPDEEIRAALIHILSEIRSHAPQDFLILVNAGPGGKSHLKSFTHLINGNFMESVREPWREYNLDDLILIEDTLTWDEENLRYPQINCVEGFGLETEHPNSPNNQKWMRVFTTLTLTHSDGYVLYNRGGFYIGEAHHDHIWYDFWDADLGRPVGGDETKAQTYNDIDGLFIREFTNGWAVYNRSGKEQQINFIAQTTGVASGATSFRHVIADLDGEMYLKTGITADINGDGVVNILDLVIVADGFGEAEHDLNGDGVVNILDLVIVANAF